MKVLSAVCVECSKIVIHPMRDDISYEYVTRVADGHVVRVQFAIGASHTTVVKCPHS